MAILHSFAFAKGWLCVMGQKANVCNEQLQEIFKNAKRGKILFSFLSVCVWVKLQLKVRGVKVVIFLIIFLRLCPKDVVVYASAVWVCNISTRLRRELSRTLNIHANSNDQYNWIYAAFTLFRHAQQPSQTCQDSVYYIELTLFFIIVSIHGSVDANSTKAFNNFNSSINFR